VTRAASGRCSRPLQWWLSISRRASTSIHPTACCSRYAAACGCSVACGNCVPGSANGCAPGDSRRALHSRPRGLQRSGSRARAWRSCCDARRRSRAGLRRCRWLARAGLSGVSGRWPRWVCMPSVIACGCHAMVSRAVSSRRCGSISTARWVTPPTRAPHSCRASDSQRAATSSRNSPTPLACRACASRCSTSCAHSCKHGAQVSNRSSCVSCTAMHRRHGCGCTLPSR